jgi:hypothetical protein
MAERIERLERLVETLVEAMSTVFLPREVRGELEPKAWLREQEYFDYDEQAKIDVTTVASPPHIFKERPVKFLWFYADGANIQVNLDKAVSGESFIIPNGAALWVRKKTRRVYGTAVAGTGTLYIWGFW